MKYDFVFVVLVYRNTQDLSDFFKNFKLKKSKVIVVNSYYDDITKDKFKEIALENNADFINVPNKGYGAGNNRGCEYALAHYDFKYLVISNADIEIEKMSVEDLEGNENEIIAPNIKDIKGKKQNPHMAFRRSKFGYKLRYLLYKYNIPYVGILLSIVSRLNKSIFYVLHNIFGRTKIFAAHGAFVIIPKKVLCELIPLYDERIFLFAEETHLGLKAERSKIETRYLDKVIINHKEDGSVGLEKINSFKIGKHSYLCLYNYWFEDNYKDNIEIQ